MRWTLSSSKLSISPPQFLSWFSKFYSLQRGSGKFAAVSLSLDLVQTGGNNALSYELSQLTTYFGQVSHPQEDLAICCTTEQLEIKLDNSLPQRCGKSKLLTNLKTSWRMVHYFWFYSLFSKILILRISSRAFRKFKIRF
jgi:hypothetical protein